MKSCVFLLYASALSIISKGYYNHKPSLLTDKNIHLLKYHNHEVYKRQGDSQYQDTICFDIVLARACTNGLLQEQACAVQRCNRLELAQEIQDLCRRNSRGSYCGEVDIFMINDNIRRVCVSSDSNCSSECRYFLLSTRSQLGCYVNLLNATTEIEILFPYSIWFNCDIEPVNEECSPSTITLPSTEIDPTCNDEALIKRIHSALCRQEYTEDIRERLSATKECQDYIYPLTSCTANKNREYCALLNNIDYIASRNCRNINTCDPLCIETLNNITDTLGCCLNEKYNSTTSYSYDWLSNEFWSRCGLESPRFCEEYLNNSSAFITASSTIINISAIS